MWVLYNCCSGNIMVPGGENNAGGGPKGAGTQMPGRRLHNFASCLSRAMS